VNEFFEKGMTITLCVIFPVKPIPDAFSKLFSKPFWLTMLYIHHSEVESENLCPIFRPSTKIIALFLMTSLTSSIFAASGKCFRLYATVFLSTCKNHRGSLLQKKVSSKHDRFSRNNALGFEDSSTASLGIKEVSSD